VGKCPAVREVPVGAGIEGSALHNCLAKDFFSTRRWSESRVVLECHWDHQQSGEPLNPDDLSFDAAEPAKGFQRPS
jgi:hypothetical protein